MKDEGYLQCMQKVKTSKHRYVLNSQFFSSTTELAFTNERLYVLPDFLPFRLKTELSPPKGKVLYEFPGGWGQ